MFRLVLSVLGSAKKNGHNLVTEILTILFPPPKHPSIGIFRQHAWSYTLKTPKCLEIQNRMEQGDLR
jgi:hypothetical protein